MSWNFGNVGQSVGQPASSGNSSQANSGPDLEEIQTDGIGFLAIAGETKLQLLPQPWPSEQLPPATASLLSISSSKGLLAAAGPETLVVATTDAVREAYTSSVPDQNGAKPFSPLASIQIPRVSQVSFSTDGSCLVIAAQEGGGLAVYDVQALRQGQNQPAFQLATDGIPVRTLAPNPAPEFSHLFALILGGGQLLMGDLKERKLIQGSQGSFFKEGVSCVSWSARGKQMVAGLQDGTAIQFDHQGNQKAVIPLPNSLHAGLPMTSIYWLSNDDFLVIHTPVNSDNTDSVYHILHREKGTGSFTSSKFLGDPTPTFGIRHPAHHFISRLKSFPPSLEDMLILASTAGTDIGVFTKSSVALTNDIPSDKIVNTYTTTSMSNDSRRAQMPMSADSMGDTSPIGMALDLSSKEKVKRPIPSDDTEETASPIPALMILDNEGRLSSWWVMYTESVRQKTAYPGLVHVQAQATPAMQSAAFQSTPSTAATQPQSATPSFGSSTFGQPSRPTFGSTSTPTFGGATTLGAKSSPWGASPQPSQTAQTFGKPTFGSATPFSASAGTNTSGPTSTGASSGFGSASAFGNKSSPWGSAPQSTSQTSGATFGQTSTFGKASGFGNSHEQSGPTFGTSGGDSNASKPSPFANFASKQSNEPSQVSPFANFGNTKTDSAPSSSPFASFSNNQAGSSAFATLGEAPGNQQSPFGSAGKQTASSQPTFGAPSTIGSSNAGTFGQGTSGFSFGRPSTQPEPSTSRDETMDDDTGDVSAQTESSSKPPPFGGFKLVSGFQGDGSTKDDLPPPANPGGSLFGQSFGNALGETAKVPSKATTLDDEKATGSAETPSSHQKQPVAAEDAPLPPDFVVPNEKQSNEASNVALPYPSDVPIKTEPKDEDDAPLPPDFPAQSAPPAEAELPPLAGSPPVDLGVSSPLSPTGSIGPDLDEDEGEAEDSDADLDEDGDDWEDETAEHSEEDVETPQVTQHGIDKASTTPFGSRLSFPSAASSAVKDSPTPLPSTTPAGLPRGPIFAPPQKESPRSPSPVRSTLTPASRQPARQVSNQQISLQARPQANTVSSTARPQKPAKEKAEPPATADLSDDEDARIKALLATEVEPTKTLDPFIAHQDYVGAGSKPGLGGQIENVYRDINSMIDTLGLNSRVLEGFMRGQKELRRQGGRQVDDLDQEDDWCIVEVEDLGMFEDKADRSLDNGMLQNVMGTLADIRGLFTETLRLRTRAAEIRRQLFLQADNEKKAAQRNAPLDTDTELQQHALRQTWTSVQKLLQDAEEQGSILRAELASVERTGHDSADRGPTVEAVTNTIMKMTAMIEQKSGDVDVLEAQIRRLPQGLAGLSLDDTEQDLMRSSLSSLRSSRRGLPNSQSLTALATPSAARQLNRRSVANGEKLGMSGMLGSRFRTPPPANGRRSVMFSTPSPGESMLGQSMISVTNRRKMADVTPQEILQHSVRAQHRKKVLDSLRETVEKKGTRVILV